MRHTKKLLPVLVATALIAAACGGDDDDATPADEPAADEPAADEPAADEPAADEPAADEPADALEGTLRVLIHQNPAGVEFFESFNDQFEADNPGVEIDLAIVEAGDIASTNQTRLNAKEIDVTTISVTGFANPVQDYMEGADTPYWQQLIEAGLLMDLTGEAFLDNYDAPAVEAGSFDGGVYGVSLGRTTYSGMFANLDLLAEVGVDVPTTFGELEAACTAVTDAGKKCMVVGGQDGWPVFVGTYGLLGALYPDQQALVEGLWTGAAKWNDEAGLELFDKYERFAAMLDAESAGLTGDAAASRYVAGDVAFGPMGGWNAGTIDDAAFAWSYIPFPGSDDAANNQTLFGKIDMSLAVAADTPVPDLAKAYLAAFSEPTNYEAFANATGYIPTQPTAVLAGTLGESIAPILQAGNFSIGFEQWYVGPKGAGQWANGAQGAQWLYDGSFGSAEEAANQAQADLESGF